MVLNPAMRFVLYISLCLGVVVSATGSGVDLTSWADTGLQLGATSSPAKVITTTPPRPTPWTTRGGSKGGAEEVRRVVEVLLGGLGGSEFGSLTLAHRGCCNFRVLYNSAAISAEPFCRSNVCLRIPNREQNNVHSSSSTIVVGPYIHKSVSSMVVPLCPPHKHIQHGCGAVSTTHVSWSPTKDCTNLYGNFQVPSSTPRQSLQDKFSGLCTYIFL